MHCTKTHLEILSIKGRWFRVDRLGRVSARYVFQDLLYSISNHLELLEQRYFSKILFLFSSFFVPDQNITYLRLVNSVFENSLCSNNFKTPKPKKMKSISIFLWKCTMCEYLFKNGYGKCEITAFLNPLQRAHEQFFQALWQSMTNFECNAKAILTLKLDKRI